MAPHRLRLAGIPITQRTPLHSGYPNTSHPTDREAAMAEIKKYVIAEGVGRFCLVGPAEACARRFRELAEVGVHEIFFRHYLPYKIPHDLIPEAARSILPAFR